MSRITVIGSFVMDNVAKTDKFPQAGETVLGNSFSRSFFATSVKDI